MFSCKYCNAPPFPSAYARTMHLRRRMECRHQYKRELVTIASCTPVWQADDPEGMPSDMEWDEPEPDRDGACAEDQPEDVDEGMIEGLRGSALFGDYLAAVHAKSRSSSEPTTTQPTAEGKNQDTNNIPHAVPAVTDYHPNKKAGRPIRFEPRANPQAQVSGNLANNACFQLADFINSVGLTSDERDTFFKLELNQHLPWKNDRQFMADIDSLPPEPKMRPYSVRFGEDANTPAVEFQTKNIVEVLEQIVGDPRYKNCIDYVPYRHFTDESRQVCVYSEAFSGNWAWRMQCLLKDELGTLLSLIFMSDKTTLSAMSGGKEGHPVYVTIGNIHKHIRRQPSKRAVVLLGYLPIPSSLMDEDDETVRGVRAWEVFHKCMTVMLEPLIKASTEGVEMWCSDGGVRRCYPILSAYVADYPEQCLVACTSRCPICEQTTEGWGELGEPAPLRTKRSTLRAIEESEVGQQISVNALGLRRVWPFWTHLPFVNLSASIPPDLLHQLHTGMFLDHLVEWCKTLMGEAEMDRRFVGMTRYHGYRHFSRGISNVSQWTGREAKEMARVFLAVIDGAVPPKAVLAARALLNFMFIAHASILTDVELDEMDKWLAVFHKNKRVFKYKKLKDNTYRAIDFDIIRKLHMIRHYAYSIRELGTPDGYNTETSELLHKSLTKNPYRASSKVAPMEQMARYVEREDAIHRRRLYLQMQGRIYLKFSRRRAGDDGMNVGGGHGEAVDYGVGGNGDGDGDSDRDEGGDDDGDGDGKMPVGSSIQLRQVPVPLRPFDPRPVWDLAKAPTWPRKPGSAIIDLHEAPELISALEKFLDTVPRRHHRPRILETHLFPCWSQCTLRFPPLPFKPTEPAYSSVVRASPVSFKDGKQTRAAAFDTVLVPYYTDSVGLTRYRAARVRAILQLPIHIQYLYPHTLVYLEFFTRFTRKEPSASGFFHTSPAFRNSDGQRKVAVYPLTAIRMPCQLVPSFHVLPDDVTLNLSSDTLGICPDFYLNYFADPFIFEISRHWESCALVDRSQRK